MRSQLLVAGVLIMLLGVMFYLLQIPLVYFWSVPFVAGGGLMAIASPFLKESQGPIEAPEGYRFCVFCGTAVKLEDERCSHCSGVQPKVTT